MDIVVTSWVSVDYDGCGDLFREMTGIKAAYEPWVAPLRKMLFEHIKGNVDGDGILACGSARQSTSLNEHNMKKNRNGCAFKVLSEAAEALKFELYKGLLEDDVRQNPNGTAWDMGREGRHTGSIPEIESYSDVGIKLALLDKQMRECASIGAKDFHFYDDRADLLKSVAQSGYAQKHGLRLHVWEWNWTDRLNERLKASAHEEDLPDIRGPVRVN